MNERVTGTALALPEETALATMLKAEGGMDDMIAQIEKAVREEAAGLSPENKKDREALKSLAYKVSQSKAALEKQALALTEKAREEIAAVNAGRKGAVERLEKLRDETRKPAVDWEEAEKARIEGFQTKIAELQDLGRVTAMNTTDDIRAVIADIEAVEIGDTWAEFEELATVAKSQALTKYRADLAAAETREKEQAELAALRAANEEREAAEQAERQRQEEEVRQKREAEEAEQRRKADLRQRVDKLVATLHGIAAGKVDGIAETFPVVEHHMRRHTEIPADLIEFEDEIRPELERAELAVQEQRAAHKVREEERAKRQREEAAAKAKADAKREADERAQKEAEEQAKREADEAHRDQIRKEIAAAFQRLPQLGEPEAMAIADAIMAGEIPHVKAVI